MNAIDATPPDDFPEQVIMMDKDLAKRHPGKAFYLRIKVEAGIEHVYFDNAVTPREARRMAISKATPQSIG
ncbi:TPA: hypothetical protein ACPIDJ_005057 [Pseudomonas aeruginosa]|uniref:hypothetical protein n=2 Tax=Pseudomonas aeruginosa TaxID=287 RepID=UPI001FFC2993|nr:hypothetical protein [Pseudomonas aeruginosa]MDE5268983.1 hypothetical protein [Pseudomonas aeruginosa]MDE5281894.1 hypothetical protein [Pseudomonas aeruginosa]